MHRDDPKTADHRQDKQVKKGWWQDAKDPPNIELFEADRVRDALLIEQEHAGNGMFLQEFHRLPYPIALFGGNEC